MDSKSREIPFLRRLMVISAAICVVTTVIGYVGATYVTRVARYHHGDNENRAGCLAVIKARETLRVNTLEALDRVMDAGGKPFKGALGSTNTPRRPATPAARPLI